MSGPIQLPTATSATHPLAEFVFTINTFRRVITTLEPRRFCAATLKSDTAGALKKHLELEKDSRGNIECVRVKAPVRLKFTILPNPDAKRKEQYVPLGIAFRAVDELGKHGADLSHIGRDVFHHVSVNLDNPSITVYDRHHRAAGAGNAHEHSKYKFYIFIQRLSDGELGIIDPGIDNKEEE